LNLQQNSKEPYNACPYCLTEITITENKTDNPPEEIETEIEIPKETFNTKQEKASTCKYHFGYLREKERDQQIPEECILCTDIIDCMLEKNAT